MNDKQTSLNKNGLEELQSFLSEKRKTQSGLVLNFGKETPSTGLDLSSDKVYLRKDFTDFLIEAVCGIKPV